MLEGFCEQGDDPSTAIEDVEFYRGGERAWSGSVRQQGAVAGVWV